MQQSLEGSDLVSQATGRARKDMAWRKKNFGVRVPRSGTHSLHNYFASFKQINSFLAFVLQLVGAIETSAKHAHTVLLEVEDDPAERKRLEEEWSKRRSPVDDLKEHRQFFMKVILVRHVENYLNYLSSILREVFLARPEALKSSERIELETVLAHTSIEELVKTISERKVESLSYASLNNLTEYFREKFHISVVKDADLSRVVEAIEIRNISVHNRCVINGRYVARTKYDANRLGKPVSVGIERIETTTRVLAESVATIDKDARRRLQVRGHRAPSRRG